MKHYGHLTEQEMNDVFFIQPNHFNNKTEKAVLAKALGATMYMPATRSTIAKEVIERKHISLTSMVIDLEDALDDEDVAEGLNNILVQLGLVEQEVKRNPEVAKNIPLIFIRIRDEKTLEILLLNKSRLKLVTGFIIPKFSSHNGRNYLSMIKEANRTLENHKFYAMPVLESKEIIYKETRQMELTIIKEIINHYKDLILNVRLGGTDFSGLYSIRRSIDTTIYDVLVVRDCISDVLNFFNRGEDDFVISGVVWEFFSHERILKPTLRETPFKESKGREGMRERRSLLNDAIDGLIREVILDKTNGIIGKTIIHPSHIRVVNALQAVTKEDYDDAIMILSNEGKGVMKSSTSNKMNEMKPHLNWANSIIEKSKVFGVLNDGKTFYDLF